MEQRLDLQVRRSGIDDGWDVNCEIITFWGVENQGKPTACLFARKTPGREMEVIEIRTGFSSMTDLTLHFLLPCEIRD